MSDNAKTPSADMSARSGAALMEQAMAVGLGKTKLRPASTIALAILAGLFIGCGALFMYFGKSGVEAFGPQSVLGGLCFSLGLICVIVAGAELFTGNCLMVIGALEKRFGWGKVFGNWALVWVFNLVGSLLLVAVVFFANIQAAGSGAIGTSMVSVAAAKINLPWATIFFRGILCNFLVCLAVYMGFAGKTVIDKIFTTIFPVMAFVAIGAEHCVANMFFLPMGMVARLFGGVDVSAIAGAANVDLGGIVWNISAATCGNIVGGVVFVAILYWIAYRKCA